MSTETPIECKHLGIFANDCVQIPDHGRVRDLDPNDIPTQVSIKEEFISTTGMGNMMVAQCLSAQSPERQTRCSHFCPSRRKWGIFRKKI